MVAPYVIRRIVPRLPMPSTGGIPRILIVGMMIGTIIAGMGGKMATAIPPPIGYANEITGTAP